MVMTFCLNQDRQGSSAARNSPQISAAVQGKDLFLAHTINTCIMVQAVRSVPINPTPRNPDDRAATMSPVTMPQGGERVLESIALTIKCLAWKNTQHFYSHLTGQNQLHAFTHPPESQKIQSCHMPHYSCKKFTDKEIEARRLMIMATTVLITVA